MNYIPKIIILRLLFIVFLYLSISNIFAWSTEDGIPICSTSISQKAARLISDGSGGAIITWYDGDISIDSNIYAQHVNPKGLISWGVSGIPICTLQGEQSSPRINSDGHGGAIIVWFDRRDNSTNSKLHIQRINSSGSILWTQNGVQLSTNTSSQAVPQLLPDGNGGAIITWHESNSSNLDIYAQHVDNSGTILWSSSGLEICSENNSQSFPRIIPDGQNGAIITWHDRRNGTNSDIYAQRVDYNGDLIWTLDGIPVCTSNNNQLYPQIVSDDEGGAIITWEDYRNTTGNNGQGSDVYAQRINSTGSTLWALNGIPICTMQYDQQYPVITSDQLGGAIISWEDFRTNSNIDIYAQHINKDGINIWDSNGITICNASNDQEIISSISDDNGGAILSWEDRRNNMLYSDIFCQRIDSNGLILWKTNGISICLSNDNQMFPQITEDKKNGAIITWYDYRKGNNDDPDIYAQRIYFNGSIQEPQGLFENLPDIKLLSGTEETSILNLDNYHNFTTANWSWSGDSNNQVQIQIHPNHTVDYLTTKNENFIGQENITYIADLFNTETANSIAKYSTYLLTKLPRVIVNNGTEIDNISVDLIDYVIPMIPINWPEPEIQYLHSNDSGKLIANITNNKLTIIPMDTLIKPAEIIITSTPDTTTNDWDKEIIRVYEVLIDYGLFDSSTNTTQWAYENLAGTSSKPTISYLDSYSGSSGVIRFNFNSPTQGIKMTLGQSNCLESLAGQWFTVRLKVMSDTEGNSISPSLFIYNGAPPSPFDVSAHALLSIPTTWRWMETALYCDINNSLYPQLTIRNGNSLGNVYVDAIQIIQAKPGIELAYGNTRMKYPSGDWDESNDTSGWAFEIAPNSNSANYSVSGGKLNVLFTGSGQEGVKMTMSSGAGITSTYGVTTGLSAGMKGKINYSGSLTNPLFMLAVYGTDTPGGTVIKELGATASVFRLPLTNELITSFIPYQPYIYGQAQVKNSANGQFSLDDLYLQSDMDSPYYWDHSIFD